jgi:gliding motility-associated-like protein
MLSRSLCLFLFIAITSFVKAQVCTNLGQNPETAFPVCGSSVFSQSTVALCGNKRVPAPCNQAGITFQDVNPYWYKFTCFTAGTLSFLITPNNLNDDYDWQLFDVTNKNPADVYTNPSLFLACNWSGEVGLTGASSAGTSLIECGGGGIKRFSAMPSLQAGHSYLLLVSHFTNSQSGYTLSFGGGTASITDTTKATLVNSSAACNGSDVRVKISKKMKCSSLAADGSDFSLSSGLAKITAAVGIGCSNGFDIDSLVLTLDKALPPGTYSVSTKKGSDGNTLLDLCNAEMPTNENISFTIRPSQPAALDKIASVSCKAQQLELTFNNTVLCNSIAADGSDFIVTGSPAITITGATTSCTNNKTKTVIVKLSSPVYTTGNYTIAIKKGSDGNTIINECNLETITGDNLSFSTKDTVSARFNYTIKNTCKSDSVFLSHTGTNQVTSWSWTMNNSTPSNLQNPVFVYTSSGSQTARLVVSNGVCTDSAVATFTLPEKVKANFIAPVSLCPEDMAVFKDTSAGNATAWLWDFGNGNTSVAKDPPAQVYPPTTSDRSYNVRLIVKNNINCADTITKQLNVLYNCFIGVPSAFTPNDDRLNDFLYPINAYKARDLYFRVYNRFGQMIFSSRDFTKKWDGTFNGIKQQTGVYVWMLDYINIDTNKPYSSKGTTLLIR